MLSWNSLKRGPGALKTLCKSLKDLGIQIALLQEVPRANELSGFTYHGYTVLGNKSSSCGIVVSRHWMPVVESISWGRDFAIARVGGCLFISAHLVHDSLGHLEASTDVSRAETAMAEISTRINIMDHRRGLPIFLGTDANVTFEANIGDFTGPAVFERPGGASHLGRTRGVQYWLQSLGLRAANTFGSSEISDSWTWGRGMKKKHSRRQLDYVLVSNYIT